MAVSYTAVRRLNYNLVGATAEKKEYLLSTELAAAVDPDAVAAKWSKKTKTLTVTCPIVG